MEYKILYDVAKEGFPYELWRFVPFWIVGVTAGAIWLHYANKNEYRFHAALMVVWLITFGFLLGMLQANVLFQQGRAIYWLHNQDYEVVEGKVENFDPLPEGTRSRFETFTIKEIPFHYSDKDLSSGGYHRPLYQGGVISADKTLRITYNQGRILRIEEPLQP